MTTLWSDVTSDDRWLALPEEAKEEIRNEYFDAVIAPEVPSFAIDQARTRFDEETSRTGKGLLNDMAERAYMGFQEMGLGLREIVGHISPTAVRWLDTVDEWMHGERSEELLEGNIQTAYEDMSPRMRESMRKDWWDEEEGKLGLAAYDPYAYIGGIAQSAPETFASMVPAFKIGKMIYGAQRAKGVSKAAAAAKAATGAQIAGSVLEGGMAGGHASRSVRQELEELSDDVWENSDLYQELINTGLSPEEAKTNIMDSSATQAMLMASAVTGAFGGFGDRVLTQGILRGLKGGIGRRMTTGAVAEGVLEEAPQEAGSQIAENIAIQQVDPTRETTAGAIGAAIGGAAVGGPMGAGFGAVSRRQPADPVAEISKAETVDEAVDAAVTATEPMPGEQEDMQRVMQEANEARVRADAEQRTREFIEQEQARASQIPEDQAAAAQERPEPAAGQDVSRQDRELTAEERRQARDATARQEDITVTDERLVADETTPKKPGQRQRLGDEDSVVVDAQRIGGVDYELYGPTKFRGKWSARIHDVDSGETVGIRQFESRADAREFHAANIKGAQTADAEQAQATAPAAQETARASIQAPQDFAKTRIYGPAPPTVVRGSTQSVRDNLVGSFGEPLISALEEKGYLSIEQEVPAGHDPATQGLLDNDQIRLFANNIDRSDDALASAVLLHEGEHLGMQPMLGESYSALQGNLDTLVASGDEAAVAAAGRVLEGVPAEDVGSERLAYFIEEAHQRIQDRQPLSNKAMELFRRIIAQLKAWFRQTRVGQAAANAGIDWQLTDDYAVALARQALKQVAARTEPRTPGPLRRQAESRAKPKTPQTTAQKRQAALESASKKIAPKRTLKDAINDAMISPKEIMADQWHRIEQGVFDRFHGLLMAEKKAGVQHKDNSGYVAARLSTSLQDVLAVLLRHGKLKWQGNILQTNSVGKGFLAALEPVADRLDDFGKYLVGLRANDLMKQDRFKGLDIEQITGFTQEEVDAMVSLGDPTMEKVRKDYMAFNKSVLDIAEKAGLIDPDARKLWESDAYLPFYRVMEEGGVAITPKGGAGLEGQSAGIRRLKGSTKAIGDPLQNILGNWTHLIDASLKNNAARQAVDNLIGSSAISIKPLAFKPAYVSAEQAKNKVIEIAKKQGIDSEAWDLLSSAESLEGMAKMMAIEPPQGKNIIRIMRDGKAEYYEVHDDLLLRSLSAINQQSWGKMMNIFRTPKRWLTTMVTADPAFMVRNFTRDTLSAWVLGRDKFIPAIDGAKGVAKAWNEDEDFIKLMAAGGTFVSGGYLNAHDPESVGRFIKSELHHKDFKKSVLNTPRKVWDFYQRIGAALENGNRVAVAMAGEGKTTTERAFEAKDLMDFSMRGDYAVMQFLAETVPFLSARVQGLHRLGLGIAEDPRTFALKGSMITMAAVALWAMNKDDDRYQELEEWDRDTYFHFFLGDEHFRLPKPFEVGMLFGTIPERMADSLSGNRGWDVFFDRLLWNFKETLAMDPWPQTFKPWIEQWANKSTFTGRPIVGMRLARLDPTAQFEPWTSETLQLLGQATGQSPKRMEALVRGYFGTMGMYILGVSDFATRNLFALPEHPEKSLEEYPIIKSFYRGQETGRYTRYTTEMYELLRELNQAHYAILKFREEGNESAIARLQEEHGDKFKYRKMMNKRQRQLSKLNKKLRKIHMSRNITAARKQELIKQIVRQRNELTRTAMEAIEAGS